MNLSDLITDQRITNLKIKVQHYPISHGREQSEMILELIREHYEENRAEGHEFRDAFGMIVDEISDAPEQYDFSFRHVCMFILRHLS